MPSLPHLTSLFAMVYHQQENGWTSIGAILLYAHCRRNESHIVDYLTSPGPVARTPLAAAARNGHAILLRHMLSYTNQVNARHDVGKTAMYLACEEGHADCVAELLQHEKIDLKVVCDRPFVQGYTCLHAASEKGRTYVVQTLLSCPEGKAIMNLQTAILKRTALAMACAAGHLEVRTTGHDIALID